MSGRELYRQTVAEIDLGRLRANCRQLRSLVAPRAFFCPMIKANAYGHGATECARALRLEGASHLGVALIEEGLELRDSKDDGEILVFGSFQGEACAAALIRRRLTPVLSERGQLEALVAAAAKAGQTSTRIKLHLKFNTGMNRLGFAVSEASALRAWLQAHPQFELEGVCTHLLRGDDAGSATGDTHSQLLEFGRALEAFRGLEARVHALNSGAVAALRIREFGVSGVGPLGARPGIAIYGAQPASLPELAVPLEAVMKLRSRLVMVNRIATGEKVSYNGTWTSKRESVIGVVGAGYADGYRRSLSNRGSVLCRGRRVPVVGTVCMDYFMVDVTDVARDTASTPAGDLAPGEEVVLIGEQGNCRVTAEELAEAAGTISYEIFTGIGSRVPRQFVGAER